MKGFCGRIYEDSEGNLRACEIEYDVGGGTDCGVIEPPWIEHHGGAHKGPVIIPPEDGR